MEASGTDCPYCLSVDISVQPCLSMAQLLRDSGARWYHSEVSILVCSPCWVDVQASAPVSPVCRVVRQVHYWGLVALASSNDSAQNVDSWLKTWTWLGWWFGEESLFSDHHLTLMGWGPRWWVCRLKNRQSCETWVCDVVRCKLPRLALGKRR